MRLTEAIEALIKAIIADGKSLKTADTYRGHLRYLVDFLGDVEIETITIDHLRAYALDLRQRSQRWTDHPNHDPTEGGLSPFSVASYVNHMKRLFNWLCEEGLLADNPAARLKRANPPRHGPKGISEEASFLTGLSPQQVQEWVDAGYVDAAEAQGRWLVEKRSLAEFRQTLIEVLANDDA